MQLPVTHPNTLAALRAASRQKHTDRVQKEKRLGKLGMTAVGKLSRRDLFIAGLALYWGEGYKGLSQELGFTNSDPVMIRFFIEWLWRVYKVSPDKLILRVSINGSHLSRVVEVERYWSRLTRVPLNQFTKTSLIKTAHKRVYGNESVHYGTLRVKVRSGTDLRRQILGSIQKLKMI